MKKFFLLAALSCFLIMQTEIVFGKCGFSLVGVILPNGPQCPYLKHGEEKNDTIYIAVTDTLNMTFYNAFMCAPSYRKWYKDKILIAVNTSKLFIITAGFYQFKTHVDGYHYVYNFTVMNYPNVIPNLTFAPLPFPFSHSSGITTLTSAPLPFPFPQTSNINPNNLRYTIINSLGQVIEQGKFSGEIILRNGNHSLQPGIYFVIYSDADDNRQVLTDKVFVSNQ
jgi:hypothetical protein